MGLHGSSLCSISTPQHDAINCQALIFIGMVHRVFQVTQGAYAPDIQMCQVEGLVVTFEFSFPMRSLILVRRPWCAWHQWGDFGPVFGP